MSSSIVFTAGLVVACSLSLPLAGCAASNEASTGGAAHLQSETCARIRGGPKGAHSVAADLSRAHAMVRYFGVETEARPVDARLTEVLETVSPTSPEVVQAYARATPTVCAAAAEDGALGAARVEMQGADLAIVSPGTGDVVVPSEAKVVAIDLRNLPESRQALAAVHRVLEAVIHGDLPALRTEFRGCNGQPDEIHTVLGTFDIDQYACRRRTAQAGTIRGGSPSARPIAVLTGPKMAPLAADIALRLRANANAFVIGAAVSAEVAESTWIGVGDGGLAVRTRRILLAPDVAMPDVVAPDLEAEDPIAALGAFDWSRQQAPIAGTAARAAIVDARRPADFLPASTRLGDARAALLVAHAATRTFFPYFDAVGDTIDARLDEVLETIDGAASDRVAVRRALDRFSEALHDGHAHVPDPSSDRAAPPAFSPLALIPVGAELAVARSASPDVKPGEVITAIDGEPAAVRLDAEMRFVSGSPHLIRAAAARSLVPARSASVTVRGIDGSSRDLTLAPSNRFVSLVGLRDRAAGDLADLGAPDVYYVTLGTHGRFPPKPEDLPAIQAGMVGKRGVILDMRGYPNPTSWQILAGVVPNDATGPTMAELSVTFAGRTRVDKRRQVLRQWATSPQHYTGPVVVLVGSGTQSQAEHLTTFFRSSNRGKVVGGKTSGANGTITGVQLPGGYGLRFTGMIVQHGDGSVFHARGHAPDVEVEQSLEDLRDGKDTVLLRALSELGR